MFNMSTQVPIGQAVQTSIHALGSGLRLLAAASLTLLAACGGGGGGDDGGSSPTTVVGPPTVAAALANSTSEAQQSAPAAVDGADKALQRINALEAFSAFVGAPITPQAVAPDGRKHALAATMKRPLATQTATCIELLDSPCSGSATLETNISDNATVVRSGDWATVQFQSLSGWLFGQQISFNGYVRFDFLSTLSLGSSSFSGLDLKVSFDSFTGSVNGASFGPMTEAFRLQITSQGASTITAGGASFSDLRDVSVTGSGSFVLGSGTVRLSYWADSSKYVDLSYSNWRVVSNRPAVGSTVTVTCGSGTITLTVTSSSTSTVVYAATITAGGSTTHYTVTATYPAGSNTASYVAVITPT